WLDQMCLAGQVVWCRLSPRRAPLDAGDDGEAAGAAGATSSDDAAAAGTEGDAAGADGAAAAGAPPALAPGRGVRCTPSRSTPLALMLRRDMAWMRAAAAAGSPEPAPLGPAAAT